jgi:hypothetical protein
MSAQLGRFEHVASSTASHLYSSVLICGLKLSPLSSAHRRHCVLRVPSPTESLEDPRKSAFIRVHLRFKKAPLARQTPPRPGTSIHYSGKSTFMSAGRRSHDAGNKAGLHPQFFLTTRPNHLYFALQSKSPGDRQYLQLI